MKSHHVALFALVILLIGAVGVAAYLYGQNKALNSGNPGNSTSAQITPGVTQTAIVTQPSVSQTVMPTSAKTASITIESEGSLPVQDVSELKLRNINPFVDWQKEQGASQAVKSITISANNNVLYPYKFDYKLVGGGNGGYLVSRKDGNLSWFFPECLNGCQFSNSFKAKYPEIVAQEQ